MTSRLTPRRALSVLALVVLGAGCASATQPALEAGSTSYSRAELDELVAEELGVGDDLPAVVGRETYLPVIGQALDDALIADVTDQLADAGGEVTDADRAAALERAGLPADFDLSSLPEDQLAAAEDAFAVEAFRRVLAEQGSSWEEYLADFIDGVRIDPRYGSFTPEAGLQPPAPPGVER